MRHILFYSTLLLVGLLVAPMTITQSAQAASDQDSPLTWEYREDDTYIVLVFKATQELEALQVHVLNESTKKRASFKRSSLAANQEWSVRIRRPKTRTAYTFELKAYANESVIQGQYPFYAGPSEDLDFSIQHARFDDGVNELRLVPTQPVVQVQLRAKDEQGQNMVSLTRNVQANRGDVVNLDFDAPRRVLTVAVKMTTAQGVTRRYEYIPWSFQTESRGLHFDTGSAVIHDKDVSTLENVYREIQQAVGDVGRFVQLELYIGGYTDTVGSDASNQRLSEQRAAAIGQWMKQQGVRVPIYTQGFGEKALAVPTADNVDEPSNRRAMFILRAGQPPIDEVFPAQRWHAIR